MAEDFHGRNLRGRSFRDKDLTGADFSGCDLHGVDFSGANLTKAKFCNAKMGRALQGSFAALDQQILLGLVSGFISAMGGLIVAELLGDLLKKLDITSSTNIIIGVALHSLIYCLSILLTVKHKQLRYILSYIVALALAGSVALALAGVLAVVLAGTGAVAGVLAVALALALALAVAIAGTLAGAGAIAVAVTYPILGLYLGWRAQKNEESQLLFLRNWSLDIACSHGSTQFAFATLQDVDFSGADLQYARFKNAKITRCCFKNAKNHHLALTNKTPLEKRIVRDLVVDGILNHRDFSFLNMEGLVLSGLDLREFNFANSNISFANFSGCDLQDANLSEVNAVGTSFNETKMTGACIANWDIDTSTELKNIRCDYVYLAEGKKKRNPADTDAYFEPGEFSKLYQQVSDTIEFIVNSYKELHGLSEAIEVLKANGCENLSKQKVEIKENYIVVTVKTPPEFNREQIDNQLKKELKKQIKKIESDYQLKLDSKDPLFELVANEKDDWKRFAFEKCPSKLPINPTFSQGDLTKKEESNNSRNLNSSNNCGVVWDDHSTATNTLLQAHPEDDKQLTALLVQLQTLINKSTLSDCEKQEAIAETQTLAKAATQPQEEQQNTVRKTLRYLKGLSSDLASIPEMAITVTAIARLFGL